MDNRNIEKLHIFVRDMVKEKISPEADICIEESHPSKVKFAAISYDQEHNKVTCTYNKRAVNNLTETQLQFWLLHEIYHAAYLSSNLFISKEAL